MRQTVLLPPLHQGGIIFMTVCLFVSRVTQHYWFDLSEKNHKICLCLTWIPLNIESSGSPSGYNKREINPYFPIYVLLCALA